MFINYWYVYSLIKHRSLDENDKITQSKQSVTVAQVQPGIRHFRARSEIKFPGNPLLSYDMGVYEINFYA